MCNNLIEMIYVLNMVNLIKSGYLEMSWGTVNNWLCENQKNSKYQNTS